VPGFSLSSFSRLPCRFPPLSHTEFDTLAERLLERLCLCASLRQRYATILSESLATFSPDIKSQAQQRLLSFLQATFTGNIRHDPKLTEALFEVALMLTGLIAKRDARYSDECRRLLAAFFEEPQRKYPVSGDKPTAFQNALLLLAGFLLTFPNSNSGISSAFNKALFARHLFFALMATAAPGVLTRTMVAMRTQSSSNPPLRLFMTPDAFAELFTQRLRSEIPALFKAVSEHFSNVTDQPSLYAFLTQASLVVSSFRAHCWENDGRQHLVTLWEIHPEAAARLLALISPESKRALATAAYDFLQLEIDVDTDSRVRNTRSNVTNPALRTLPDSICHPVMNGAVAGLGLSSWASGVFAKGLRKVDEALRLNVASRKFFGVGLDSHMEKSIETMATEPSVSASVENLPQTEDQIKEHITHALMRYASEHKAVIRTAANRTAQGSSAAQSQLPALPAGLFVPSRFFTGPISLWISPLQALGLAVSCTREVSEAADNESESQTETMIALYRHSPGNPLPETGVLFPFFESVSAAIWWVEHMTEFHSTKLSDVTRKDLLKQFLFTDAMARLLRLFIRESREADQEIGNRMLAQSAVLTHNQTGERTKRELQKFVKPKLLRKLCSASIAEVAHGYLTHELRRKGETDVSTGLEIVLDIQKRQLAAARSKRMKRVVARPDS
jgi:hypothetical protein